MRQLGGGMMLRLTVVEGAEAGRAYPSSATSAGIGSAADNEVQLDDQFVSRHHGRLLRVADGWVYRDLGSTNGSTIERAGKRIALDASNPESDLRPGDLLLLGRSVLRFELIEQPAAGQAEPTEAWPDHTLVASREIADLEASRKRQLSDLSALSEAYQLERQLGLLAEPEQMLDVILEAMLSAFPGATHAILLLIDKKTGRPRRQMARVRGEEGRAKEEIPVSMSVASRVLTEGRSLLFLDVPREFADSQSAAAAGISSSLCAPLWTGEETVGLVQVESRHGTARFSEGDLDRLSLFANRAALAIVASELHEAEETNRLLRDLSAMVTHDLKGPLTAITGFLDLLAAERLSDEQAEYVEVARASSKWLSVLIAGILDVAKMESSGVRPNLEPVALAEDIPAVLELIGYQIQEKRIALETALPDDLPTVLADREMVRRIVVNLVGNSVKFAPEQSTITVSARAAEKGDHVVVSVQDQGPGISKEHQARIFEKFVQVGKGRSAEKVSVGLGLAFCKMAVEAHGGRIWVESEPGHGACFSFSLPLGAAAGC
jgi:signal transduction histidine kinase